MHCAKMLLELVSHDVQARAQGLVQVDTQEYEVVKLEIAVDDRQQRSMIDVRARHAARAELQFTQEVGQLDGDVDILDASIDLL